MARNKYGFPTKKKKTMLARGFADGGAVEERPTKLRMALESVGENVTNLPRRAATMVKKALTVEPTEQQILQRAAANRAALNAATDTDDEVVETKPEGMKRGGKVKPRGVGCAMRGHGKGNML